MLVVLAVAAVAPAQPKTPTRLDHLSPVERAKENFYGAIAGPGVTVLVEWVLSANTVEFGNTVTLTLTVRNAVNPRELKRPDLAKLPDFQAKFASIEPVPGPEPAEDAKAVEFVYTLRPRNEGTITVALPAYLFFHPLGPKDKKFQSRLADDLTLTVTKPVVKDLPPIPLTGPESFFAPATGSYSAFGSVPSAYWLALLLAAPLLFVGWVLGWRWLFPTAARQARLRRNRAVRRTLDRLRSAPRAADPAGETAAALRYYLSARFGLPPVAATPAEVSAGLRTLTVPAERVAEADELLRRCDADRFAANPARSAVPTDAIRLVERWEGVTS